MKLELKNIRIVKALSEETTCFTAFGYVDGIKTFIVCNRGHGGCHDYTEVDCKPETRARFDAVDAWAKSLPPQQFDNIDLPSDLDSVVDDLMLNNELRQILKRMTKNKIAFIRNNKLWTLTLRNTDPNYVGFAIASFKAKNPDAKVLNDMPEQDALALLKVAA
jgi:hypothetical protein